MNCLQAYYLKQKKYGFRSVPTSGLIFPVYLSSRSNQNGGVMLDFSQVAAQIRAFTTEHAGTLPLFQAALAEAGRRLRESALRWEGVQARIEESKTSWLLAEWREPPEGRFAALPRPTPCVVYAADG